MTTKMKQQDNEISIISTIIKLDSDLEEYDEERKKINSIKNKKDEFIKKYIKDNNFPTKLQSKYLNYKALLFYFIESFTISDTILYYNTYKNDTSRLQLKKKESFKDKFKNNLPIKINVNIYNFPHLIGYKRSKAANKPINLFIKDILYESDLSHNYESDGCNLNKIEAFAWILETLKKPFLIYDQDGIKQSSLLKSNMVFIRRDKDRYHYVSLQVHSGSDNNQYYINSHHSLTEKEYRSKFNQNKYIYKYKSQKNTKKKPLL